jgi:hypothetical protein
VNPNLSETQFPRKMKVQRKTDWGHTYQSNEDVIHRGVGMSMPPYRAARFHAAQTPEEKAQIVMEHVQADPAGNPGNGRGGALGQHWTTQPSVARGFSGPGAGRGDIPVIFHAEPPKPSHVYSPEGQARHGIGGKHYSESETTLRSRAPVRLLGMSFPDDPTPGPQETGYGTYVPVSARLKSGGHGAY